MPSSSSACRVRRRRGTNPIAGDVVGCVGGRVERPGAGPDPRGDRAAVVRVEVVEQTHDPPAKSRRRAGDLPPRWNRGTASFAIISACVAFLFATETYSPGFDHRLELTADVERHLVARAEPGTMTAAASAAMIPPRM